ncbi:nickel-dependent hydrogenase large subunit [Bradyrhizobium sp.]|uniref:nickel-dependent hydrogenase large subunit n=1 Tax=Bradyrhizobium sp. TaxID=376 RepID=UPI00403804F6
MSIAFRNEIDVTVLLARGAIADVEILPRTRPPLTRLFAGKQVGSLFSVLPRLFSLCSCAHQVAFVSAVEAARGQTAAADARHRRVTAVIAERLTELLRGLFVGRLALDSAGAAAVRSMMQAATVLGYDAADTDHGPARRESVSRIRAALTALGVSDEEGAPAPGSALAAHVAALDDEAFSPAAIEPSFLSSADDRDVLLRLRTDGAQFSDAPDLQGRVPETGVWARRAMREPALPREAGPAARLKARIAEAARLCAWLEAGDELNSVEDGIVESYNLGASTGAAAVECARGRLYHLVELDGEDQISRFEFLAPTEWNFHARGPLVQGLQGSVLSGGRQGQEAVRAMVGSFDPCVAFSLTFREAAHA